MIDHLTISVKDVPSAVAFYTAALGPLGYSVLMQFPGAAGLGVAPKPDLWMQQGEPHPQHIAFSAQTRAEVDAFHAAAIKAGAKDNGGPGLRAHYHPSYYGAFVIDADGYNIEAVCHKPE